MDATSYYILRQLHKDREIEFTLCLVRYGLKYPRELLSLMLKNCFAGATKLVNIGIKIIQRM
jgi:hypothetical protein